MVYVLMGVFKALTLHSSQLFSANIIHLNEKTTKMRHNRGCHMGEAGIFAIFIHLAKCKRSATMRYCACIINTNIIK